MKMLTLGSRTLSDASEPYVIAEIGVNHEGSMTLARQMIEQAKQAGADAAKFQSYKANTLASRHSPAYWDKTKEPTESQHALFSRYDSFGPEEYRELAAHCKRCGIDFVSTPFDYDAIEFLDPLVPFYKVASADITNIPFLRRVAKRNKPVVISTGASTLGEIDIAVETLRQNGASDIVLLHCILNYPTENPNAHLRMISGLKRAYPDSWIGYSDHTLPGGAMLPLVTATLLGSVVVEKHFTYDKSLPGNDHYHAMDAQDLRRFREALSELRELLGPSDHKAPLPSEEISRRNARRNIVLARSVSAGEQLNEENLVTKRPGTGISPLHWDEVIGAVAAADLPEDHILSWTDFTIQR